MSGLPKIFVSIASYRDPQCQYTVKDLFDKAAHPERVTVGICAQLDPEHDQDCTLIPPPYPDRVREVRVHANDTKGGCWARAKALSLLEAEDFVLQIDAHMRFVEGWDDIMLENLRQCPSSRAGLSTIPPYYVPPAEFQDCSEGLPVTYVSLLGKPGELQPLHLGGWIRKFKRLPNKGPVLGAFIIGNFLFVPAQAFREVPFDPHIYFRGQELTYSARLWTHGWDIYQPDRVVIYHYWASKTRGDSSYKSTNDAALRASQRVWHLLGLKEASDPAILVDIEKYNMGSARPLEHFWEFAGIDRAAWALTEKASKGYWTPYRPE